MKWNSPADAMPWVGLYVSVVSLICILAMAADTFLGFRKKKLWFPCRFFTMNAAFITLIAIAMKLPVDLSSVSSNDPMLGTKFGSLDFLVTILANFVPSLGLLDDKELEMNIVALGILIITIYGNIFVQFSTMRIFFSIQVLFTWIFPLSSPFLVALSVPASRRILQHRYKELHRLASTHQEINFSHKRLIHYVKKHWMMAETTNPQFVIACSPVSTALGVVCSYNALYYLLSYIISIISHKPLPNSKSDYKWSIKVIGFLQTVGIIVGSIAPIFRCLTAFSHFNFTKKWNPKHQDVFRFGKHCSDRIRLWKCIQVPSHISGYHRKKLFRTMKIILLSLRVAHHMMTMGLCAILGFLPTYFLLSVSHYCTPLLKRFTKEANASNTNLTSDIEEYACYVPQFEQDVKLSKRILRNALNSITQIIHESEEKEPSDLIRLIQKSTGFNGVVEFDNDQVPPLHAKTQYCWSLVTVTLTSIAIALPNITKSHVKGLLAGMTEGLQFVRHIEEILNADGDVVNARKAAGWVWTEVELSCKWLGIDLQKKTPTVELTSKEIIKWLGDEATKNVILCKIESEMDRSKPKFIAASSMYRISHTIMLHCNEQENWPTDEELYEWISTIIADLLCACFTNLPRVITMKCHEDAIEKREDSIRIAAQLLGRSKKILKMLKKRQLPNLDMDSTGYIDKWHALPKSQIPNGSSTSTTISAASSSS